MSIKEINRELARRAGAVGLCAICEEDPNTLHRCTHCDKWICRECFKEKLDGGKNCMICGIGLFYP